MKAIRESINHQKSLKTKMPPFYGGQERTDRNDRTERTIQANRPDIVIKNHNDKTCFLIDMSVPNDTNIFNTKYIQSTSNLTSQLSHN